MAPAKPEGLLLGPPARPWRVGRELGRGACGSVHEIHRHHDGASSSSSSSSGGTSYVVKIAPIPPSSSGGPKKKTKKKKTALERNADLLFHENTLYRNVLNDMRGKMVPEVPHPGDGGPPGYGDVEEEGYRFLCMEKMDAPLSAVVPALLAEAKKGKRGGTTTIPLGQVAATMIGLVEALHAKRLLFVDVKAENFMLASSTSSSSSSSGKRAAKKGGNGGVCSRLRMIDFGLVESYRDVASGGHREDMHPDSMFVGTPEYASLNVLRGHTASRRDDLEAVGYVLAELVVSAVEFGSASGGSSGSGKGRKGSSKKASSTTAGAFPWSSCQSDEEVLRVKAGEVEGKGGRAKSAFFARMGAGGNADVEKAMRSYFTEVRNLGYSEKPDYDELRGMVDALKVTIGSAAAAGEVDGGNKKPAAASRGRATKKHEEEDAEAATGAGGSRKRATRSSAAAQTRSSKKNAGVDAEDGEDETPADAAPKKRRGRTTRTGGRASRVEDEDDIDMQDVVVVEDDDDDDDFHSCSSGQMDWELVSDENEAPPAAVSASASAAAASSSGDSGSKSASNAGAVLLVVVIDGPHKGESFGLGGGSADVITVGRGPSKPRSSSSGGADIYKLGRDDEASASHVKLSLYSAKGGAHSVRVTDLKATNGTYVNGKEVSKGKYKQAFIRDKIQVGESTLQIKRGA